MGNYATIIEALAVARDLGRISPEAYRAAVGALEDGDRHVRGSIKANDQESDCWALLDLFDLEP